MNYPLTLTTPETLASDLTDALTRLIDSRLRHLESRCADLESVVLTQDARIDAFAELDDVARVQDDQIRDLQRRVEAKDDQIRDLETALHDLRRHVERTEASASEIDDDQIRDTVRDMIRDGEIVVTLDYV